ncbi:MAG TPA: hypothetical protein VM597_01345 [Gemmataceae bacterium]|jgi:hypothetical protein|nr:hypothetical protein [Gemmataceae bacterium]
MLTKVLAVVFAVAIPAVGGVVYIGASGKCPFSCAEQAACPAASASVSEETPSCCQSASRTSCLSLEGLGCCGEESEATPEVLAIQPRELK